MLPTISPSDAHALLREGKARLVDVREPDELAAIRIPGAEVAPLSVIDWMRIPPASEEQPIIFTCRSGKRTDANSDALQALARGPARQLEGGIAAWSDAGLPVIRESRAMPIFRQIQICAGLLVLLGTVGGMFWPPLLWISVFVGAGLTFAGVTGFCGLGLLLAAMPWNKQH